MRIPKGPLSPWRLMPQRKIRSGARRRSRRTLPRILRGQRRPRSFHHLWPSSACSQNAQGRENRQNSSFPSFPTSRTFAWNPSPHRRHLFQRWPEVRACDVILPPLLQGSQERPDPRRGHHRSRLRRFIHRRRLRLTHPRHQHLSVLSSIIRCSRFSASPIHLGRRCDMRTRGFLLGGTAGRTTRR